MRKYIIIETTKNESPENTNHQVSKFFDAFAEANNELHARFNALTTEEKNAFNQSIISIEL